MLFQFRCQCTTCFIWQRPPAYGTQSTCQHVISINSNATSTQIVTEIYLACLMFCCTPFFIRSSLPLIWRIIKASMQIGSTAESPVQQQERAGQPGSTGDKFKFCHMWQTVIQILFGHKPESTRSTDFMGCAPYVCKKGWNTIHPSFKAVTILSINQTKFRFVRLVSTSAIWLGLIPEICRRPKFDTKHSSWGGQYLLQWGIFVLKFSCNHSSHREHQLRFQD